LIDFAKIRSLPEGVTVNHRSPWKQGNYEDGLLFGVDNLIDAWSRVQATLMQDDGVSAQRLFSSIDMEPETRRIHELEALLLEHGVDTAQFGTGNYHTLEELCFELFEQRVIALEVSEKGVLRRACGIIRAWILAEINSQELVLMDTDRKGPFARKVTQGETWEKALRRAVEEMTGVVLDDHFDIMFDTYMYNVEEKNKPLYGYPGLGTVYRVHEVDLRVKDPGAPALSSIGLPAGSDFTRVLGFNVMSGSELRRFAWRSTQNAGYIRRGTVAGAGYDLGKSRVDGSQNPKANVQPHDLSFIPPHR